jgi:hypothetical protein
MFASHLKSTNQKSPDYQQQIKIEEYIKRGFQYETETKGDSKKI